MSKLTSKRPTALLVGIRQTLSAESDELNEVLAA
jgi:hypothetical protein